MELRQLRYFVAVCDHLSFSRAARALDMAQPPLSVQIRKLEAELGFSLFDRSARQITLTPAGRVFADEARAVIDRAEIAVESAQDAAHGRAGRLVLRVEAGGAWSERLTRRIRKFLRKNRGLRLTILTVPSEGIPVDATIRQCPESALPPSGVVLERGAVGVALPPKHRLADRREVTIPDLLGETLFVAPAGEQTAPEQVLLAAAEHAGLSIPTLAGPDDFAARLWRVSLGLGCAAVTEGDRPTFDATIIPLGENPEAIVTALVPQANSRAAALPVLAESLRLS